MQQPLLPQSPAPAPAPAASLLALLSSVPRIFLHKVEKDDWRKKRWQPSFALSLGSSPSLQSVNGRVWAQHLSITPKKSGLSIVGWFNTGSWFELRVYERDSMPNGQRAPRVLCAATLFYGENTRTYLVIYRDRPKSCSAGLRLYCTLSGVWYQLRM